ncbi:chalcone synthase [Mycena maculata]|uniref:Chalcone synthase n=1 Tax=Mycena maculata TaxID=230809 RepID=A0AAD7JK17_9AGAR|nr:chalcone synthase [Mycena maculata]
MLKITGLGVAYPPDLVPVEGLDKTALDKVLAINRSLGIKMRSMVVPWDSPFLNQPTAPSIKAICDLFLDKGLKLAISAARAAIAEAGIPTDEITHVVASTCTNSSNPGYDLLLAQELGLRHTVEKVLLHGVGCTGGLAGLRLADNLCHTAAWRGRPTHVLVVAAEFASSFTRNELECVDRDQDVRVGLAIPGTDKILTFNPGPQGWQEIISPQLPILTASDIPVLYEYLLSSLPASTLSVLPTSPSDYDWPIHTGGSAFLKSTIKGMGIEREHLQASWEVYEHHGNTSSSSVFCVLDMSRRIQEREWVVSLGFGPGLVGEAVLLRRIQRPSASGEMTVTVCLPKLSSKFEG